MAIIPLNKVGKMPIDIPVFNGHSGSVLDFDFNPFHDNLIASGSEDTSIKVWEIPEGGLTENIKTPVQDLSGHSRKVVLLRFHPTADNVLGSVGGDQTIKIWDIERGLTLNNLADACEQLIQDMVWDYTGKEYAFSCKDKAIRLVDARSAAVTTKIENAHEGAKSIKLTYLGNHNKLFSIGFTRQSHRQYKIWDPRNTSTELDKVDIDTAAGVIMPFFDVDTSLLYLAGKGDGNVRFYEFVNEPPYFHPLSDFRSAVPAKGMAFVPKRGLNVLACETARLLKLTSNGVEPLSFFVPRKAEGFQEDLYPDTSGGEAAHTASQWFEGSDLPPKLVSLNPNLKGPAAGPAAVKKAESSRISFSAAKSSAVLMEELAKAQERIKKLEDLLKSKGIPFD